MLTPSASEQKAVTSIAQALGKKYRLMLDEISARMPPITFRCIKVYTATELDGTRLVCEGCQVPTGTNSKTKISELLGYAVNVLVRIYPTPWEGHEAWWLGEHVAGEHDLDNNPLGNIYSEFSGVGGPVIIRNRFGDVDPTIIPSSNQRLFSRRARIQLEEQRQRALQDLPPPQPQEPATPPPPPPEEQTLHTKSTSSMMYTISRIYNSTSGDDDDEEDEQTDPGAVIVEIDVQTDPYVSDIPQKARRIRTDDDDESPVAHRRPRRKCRK